jgi:hypothetical protein
MRATLSVDPPGGNGTIIVTGFSGQAAWAPPWWRPAAAIPELSSSSLSPVLFVMLR